ncbi:MAG: cobalt-precorrin-5B (C(1))-methyltransferase CbiD [Myxococcaceae bacterium]
MTLFRTGFSTGTCAAAAAKAAASLLANGAPPKEVEVGLPDGTRVTLPVDRAQQRGESAEAVIRKDAGDDPDVTHRAEVIATVSWVEGEDVTLRAGAGVGTVTRPGLSVPPGEPAVNPVPRRMIRSAVREVTGRGVEVVLSIPGGQELAAKTFNPRLGVVGGLSILGTTGRVRPFSAPALREALRCSVSVAAACKVAAPVLVPGHLGERAARKHFRLGPEQVIEVSNEWGFMLDQVSAAGFGRLLVAGHPGKLAKLVEGQWDTHSSRSASAVPIVARVAQAVLGRAPPESATVEGLLAALEAPDRRRVAEALAAGVAGAVQTRWGKDRPVAAALFDLAGALLGSEGDLDPWR